MRDTISASERERSIIRGWRSGMTSSRVRRDMCRVEDAIMGTVFDAGRYCIIF